VTSIDLLETLKAAFKKLPTTRLQNALMIPRSSAAGLLSLAHTHSPDGCNALTIQPG
jgi:hypothetical protein